VLKVFVSWENMAMKNRTKPPWERGLI